ncbi:MAG TPA: BON domain-containing protein [Castellaniella sp.]|jgi:hyperosmotically inducible protein|nr:BON domain-containing protein [Castellaniella sp.]
MTRSRTIQALSITAAALVLTACSTPYRQPLTDTGQTELITNDQSYYRGTQSGMAVVNTNDAMINANVINAISTVPGLRQSNIQVSTLQGVVTLRGSVDSQMTAQSAVQAARQVPGVRTVNYDLRIM